MNRLLENQIAIVTGGNAGIGRAIAVKFAEQGAKIAIFGTNAERGALVVQEINQLTSGDSAKFFQVDVAKTDEVSAAVKQVIEAYGKIDVLVNNAGITKDNLLLKMTEADWDSVIDTNLKSCFNTCQCVYRPMMKARRGRIINVSSVVGLTGNPGQVNYAASKSGMIGFTKALAKELASRNILINCIAPGFIKTQMTHGLTEVQQQELLKGIPLGRMGDPADIANAALYLASSLSDYVTGQVLTVDGGMVM